MKKFLLFLFLSVGLFFVLPQITYAADTCTSSYGTGTCEIGCNSSQTLNPSGPGACAENWFATSCCLVKKTYTNCEASGGTCKYNCSAAKNEVGLQAPTTCDANLVEKSCCVIRRSGPLPAFTPTPPFSACNEVGNPDNYCKNLHGEGSICGYPNGGDYGDGCNAPKTPLPTSSVYCTTQSDDFCNRTYGNGSGCSAGGEDYVDGCTEPNNSVPLKPKPTATSKPAPGSSAPRSSGGGGGGSQPAPQSCPADGDNCWYNEGNKCYSGRTDGEGGVNVDGCVYSCGPVDSSNCKEKNSGKKSKNKKTIECTPGEPVNDCSTKCKNGGTCKQAHTFCEWTEDGNVESKCVCDDEDSFCSSGEEKGSGGGSCKDNPTSPPDGYTWKNSCKSCSNNDDCPRNNSDGAVNPDTSNWCFGGSCLMLTSGGSSEKKSSDSKKKTSQKEKDKKKKKDVNDGKTKDDTGNRTKQNNEKTARDKAQKPIDKLNKDRLRQGLPTLTPLPQNWTPDKANPTATPIPTPLPPLPEPTNWQGFCAQTTDPTRPWGIRVSWNPVAGASRYAVRIDEDAPSWEGDTPSPGDTVDNQVKDTVSARVVKPGAVYQWWVHSVNASGVYSGLTKKLIIKCPEENPKTGTISAQTVGAGQLIVLPQK